MYRGGGLPFMLSTVSNALRQGRSRLGPGFLQYFIDSTSSDLEKLPNSNRMLCLMLIIIRELIFLFLS